VDPGHSRRILLQHIHLIISDLVLAAYFVFVACPQTFTLVLRVGQHFANKHTVDPKAKLAPSKDDRTICVATLELQVVVVFQYEMLLSRFE
jgi:hypothetical protein